MVWATNSLIAYRSNLADWAPPEEAQGSCSAGFTRHVPSAVPPRPCHRWCCFQGRMQGERGSVCSGGHRGEQAACARARTEMGVQACTFWDMNAQGVIDVLNVSVISLRWQKGRGRAPHPGFTATTGVITLQFIFI